jgi:hypothetical protein
MDTLHTLMSILASRVCMQTAFVAPELDAEEWQTLYKLAGKHDLAHIVGDVLAKDKPQSLPDPLFEKLQKQVFVAVCRYEKINYAATELYKCLEEAGIPFIPLKGAVLRALYPEPWLRTSSDIDVLIHPEDLPRAEALLADGQYQRAGKGSHDVSFIVPGDVHIELHYDLIEEGILDAANDVLRNVWQHATPREESSAQHVLDDAFFYFYHIAHMAKHMLNGGCGIRPVLDLWLLLHRMPQNDGREALLASGGLSSFANTVCELAEIWFSGKPHNERSLRLQNYLLYGGVYGNKENRVQVQNAKKGSHLRYAFSRIFLPYDTLKYHYPVLQKHRWLTPLCEVRRWGKLLFCGGAKRSLDELAINARIDRAQAEKTATFLSDIGL